jgi:3',5'-cyclic-AMP phosphodiesterase
MNRRNLLKQTGLLGLLGLTPGIRGLAMSSADRNIPSAGGTIIAPRKRVVRFAHLTDIHIEPELHAAEGLAACLHHLQGQADRPSFIMSGGDCVFDSLKADRDRVNLQWNLWHEVWQKENSLPIEHCIGNHDCWAMGEKSDPLYGKKFALDKMRLDRPYRSFDKGGWHFIVLDSIQPKQDGSWYTTQLDDEQYHWLEQDLAGTPAGTPVIVVSHVPILSAAVLAVAPSQGEQGYKISGAMHSDAARIITLFNKYKNVKLCLSGHIHLAERIVYDGVTYISNGAVSGNWWKGINHETPNGYAMLNLYDDGSFENEYVPYGWTM